MTDPLSFAEVLRRHRHAARLTLEQLAEASGVSAQSLSNMERGRSRGPQHRTVTALADALALDESARKQLIELARDGRLRDHWTRPTGLCALPRSVGDFTGRAAKLASTNDLVHAGASPGAAGVGLITGPAGRRRLLVGLEGVRRLSLGPLSLAEATELLTGILGDRSASDGERALAQLAQLCSGLPLVLRITGNRLVSRPAWSAAELVARLANEERRLEQFSADELKIANAFGMS